MSRESSQRLGKLTPKDQIYSEEDARYFNELYEDQLEWTVPARKRLYRRMNLFHAKNILEVGSGTGALLREIQAINPRAKLVGLDWNMLALKCSHIESLNPYLICGKGEELPFPSNHFDITLCHYFLMWVQEPLTVLQEMNRVTRNGGWVACLAEPDYGGRLDYPASELWRELLLGSLSAPDPFIGRRIRKLFIEIGLQVDVGLQSAVLPSNVVMNLYKDEIGKLAHFLGEKNSNLIKLKKTLDKHTPEEIFSFMPVFFGVARKRT